MKLFLKDLLRVWIGSTVVICSGVLAIYAQQWWGWWTVCLTLPITTSLLFAVMVGVFLLERDRDENQNY